MEQSIAERIEASNPTETRVRPERIQALMERVELVLVEQPAGTTSTFVHAYLDGVFFLASGFSGCVDPANYRADIGRDIARKSALAAAEQKLWELEGYALYQRRVMQ